MYVVEGQITIRRNLQEFIGQFGVFHSVQQSYDDFEGEHTTSEVHMAVASSERLLSLTTRGMRRSGQIPENAVPEQITSLEQAEKYAQAQNKVVSLTRHFLPNLGVLLDAQVPENTELLGGVASLWKERRAPTPYVYLVARGRLLAEVEYTPEEGWLHTSHELEGMRIKKGIMAPGIKRYNQKVQVEKGFYNRPLPPLKNSLR